MNLRYHKIDIPAGIRPEDGTMGKCLSVLTMSPTRRAIRNRNDGSIQTVWYPYTTFAIEYYRRPGGFLYYGQPGSACKLFFHDKPLQSLGDRVYAPATENGGVVVCTDHGWDGVVFKKIRTLLGTVIDL